MRTILKIYLYLSGNLKNKNMKKATLSLELAKKMFDGKDQELKAFALESYPELNQKITDRVKSILDAIDILGEKDELVIELRAISNISSSKSSKAFIALKIIAKALNGNWTPDWNNSNEYKYYPWFRMRDGFSSRDCCYDLTHTRVGSRLCYKSSELAEYAGKQFEDLYKEYMTS